MCKNVPETVQLIKKSSNFVKKNGLNFKLKHRNAQKSILSGRFSALTGRSGDLMKNLETPGKTGRVDRYVLYCLQIRSRLGASAASALRHKKNTPYIKRYKDISENIVKRLIHRFSQG